MERKKFIYIQITNYSIIYKVICILYLLLILIMLKTFLGQFSMPKPLSPKTSAKPAQILMVNDESFAVVG